VDSGPVDSGSLLDATLLSSYDAPIFTDAAGLVPIDDAASPASSPPDGAMRGGGGDSTICTQALAWRVTGATLDPAVVGSGAAAQLNPLLSAQQPLTLADVGADGGGMVLQVSGTLANGIAQQYFPYQYPASPAPLVISVTGALPTFLATSPVAQPSTGWLHVVDVATNDVWIPMSNISTSATAGDALCGSLTGGEVLAVIPASGAGTSMMLGGGATTVAQLFGTPTSVFPPGWSVRLLFPTASKVQVTFK
jgi:hypothetical protein